MDKNEDRKDRIYKELQELKEIKEQADTLGWDNAYISKCMGKIIEILEEQNPY